MTEKEMLKEIVDYDRSNERLDFQGRENWLNKQLIGIVKYAYKNAPAIRDILEKANVSPSDIRSVEDLEKLPVTTKDALVKLQRANPPFGGFLGVPINKLSRVYVSPGPIYDTWSEKRLIVQARGLYNELQARPGEIAIVSATYHMVPAGLVMTDVLEIIGITVVPAGTGQTELQVQVMRELGINGYYGFPSFLMTIIQKAEEMGYDINRDFKLRWAPILGERHGELLRKKFEEDYNIKTWQVYGTAEAGIIGTECSEKNGMHFNDENVLVQICDPDTGKQLGPGEEGEVVVTLFDEVYPLIRFGTGDLASYSSDPCPCGRTSPRITKISGMIGDHIRVKSMFVHKGEVVKTISNFPEISKAQMVITLSGHKDVITFQIEPDVEDFDKEAFSKLFIEKCQDVFKLRPDEMVYLPKGSLPDEYQVFIDKRWD